MRGASSSGTRTWNFGSVARTAPLSNLNQPPRTWMERYADGLRVSTFACSTEERLTATRFGCGFDRASSPDACSPSSLEPDLENFGRLTKSLEQLRVERRVESMAWPCGLSSSTGLARFMAGGGESSRIDEGGALSVPVVGGDDVLPGTEVDLIKLDVEGAEPDALRGLQRTIRSCRPLLAISAYHSMAHLWELPTLVRAIHSEYEFDLRSHGHHGMDLVLYAVPRSS